LKHRVVLILMNIWSWRPWRKVTWGFAAPFRHFSCSWIFKRIFLF